MKQLVSVVLAISLAGLLFGCGAKQPQLTVGWAKVMVEIRDTPEGQAQGLSGRQSLGKNQGMLFVFPTPAKYKFWMKEMNFPLDFVWIQGDQVLEITENVGIDQMNIKPTEAVDRVLEVNGGWVRRNNVRVGDKIRL